MMITTVIICTKNTHIKFKVQSNLYMFIYFLYVLKYKYIKQKKNTGHSSGTVVKVFLNSFKWRNSLLLKKNKQT